MLPYINLCITFSFSRGLDLDLVVLSLETSDLNSLETNLSGRSARSNLQNSFNNPFAHGRTAYVLLAPCMLFFSCVRRYTSFVQYFLMTGLHHKYISIPLQAPFISVHRLVWAKGSYFVPQGDNIT